MPRHEHQPLVSLKEQIDAAGDSDESDSEHEPCLERLKAVDVPQALAALRYKYGVYVDFTWREMKKRKVSYCLGTCSCFIVVLTVALLVTTLANLPIVFLRLAELENSERDLSLTGGGDVQFSQSLNYTKFEEALRPTGEEYSYHSPRLDFKAVCTHTKYCDPEVLARNNTAWMYTGVGFDDGVRGGCSFADDGCLSKYCTQREDLPLYAIDTAKEERMGYGRAWPYTRIERGKAFVDKDSAGILGAKKGDTVIVTFAMSVHLVGILGAGEILKDEWPFSDYATVHVPYEIAEVLPEPYGKIPDGDPFLFVELDEFWPHVSQYLNPNIPAYNLQKLREVNIYHYVTEINVNMDPTRRRSVYDSSNYDVIQEKVVQWVSRLLYLVGFNQVDTGVELLEFMYETRFFALFLGLLISLVIVVLTALSILLIYSLLMINVETRTFELGVLRMTGMKRNELVQLVLTQAFLYALPAWGIGLVISAVAWLMIGRSFEDLLTVQVNTQLDPFGVGMATLVGLGIPLIAAIVPINQALGMNLQDSLDTRHSKTKAVKFEIERSEGSSFNMAAIIMGVALAVFGFLIYYMFPLALLTFNIALLFYIFFGILLGLLLGLILLSLNFENLVERLLVFVFFFWENTAVRTIVVKNLVAHRPRNRKTTLMYAGSLGFIIWITVSWQLQIQSVSYARQQQLGGSMAIYHKDHPFVYGVAHTVEKVLEQHSELVKDWAYSTTSLDEAPGGLSIEDNTFYSTGRFLEYPIWLSGITPNYYEGPADRGFLRIREQNSSHDASISQQLYTRWNVDGALVGSLYADLTGKAKSKFLINVEVMDGATKKVVEVNHPFRAVAVLDASPALRFSQFPRRMKQNVAVGIPGYLALANGMLKTVNQVTYHRMVVELRDGWTAGEVDQLKVAVANATRTHYGAKAVEVKDIETEVKATRTASAILERFFLVVTFIAMAMCFFSLMASMYSNIHEQSKEIGVMRSLGLRIWTTKRIYVWEAFILVVAASCMGFMVGTMVAWTMVIQRSLFLQLPLDFVFPWTIFLFVVGMALVFAVLASYGPITRLLRMSVVNILRKTN